ncbi:MAG: hypothetical protein M1511_15655, partial [Deltaproteobacteria bacterium]|nr:hypothetical protein [Deltaproteobacteria bacterium]
SAVNKATFVNDLGEAIDVEPKVNEAYMQYEYDAAGNRTAQYFTVVLTHETHYRYYANSNRLLADGKWAYIYDANGNLIKKGNQYQITGEQVTFTTDGPFAELWEYGYDLLNRLVTVKKNGVQVSSYVYDPTGLRVAKRGSKGETDYAFDLSGNAIYEKDVATGQERSYVWVGGQHFARVDGGIGGTGAKYFYHTDHEGSLTAVTDSAGVVLWRSDNLPFGGKIEQDREYTFAEDRGFTGKEWDEDTGLYYFNARWYDSELGRFITEDTYAGDPNDPRTLNLFIYVGNNPLRYVDSTGNEWQDTTIVIIGFADNNVMTFSARNTDRQQRLAVKNTYMNAENQEMNVAEFRAQVYYASSIEKILQKAFGIFGLNIGDPKPRNVQLTRSSGFSTFRAPKNGSGEIGLDFAAFLMSRAGLDTYGTAGRLTDIMFGPGTPGMIANRIIGFTGVADSFYRLQESVKQNEKMLASESIGLDYLSQVFAMNREEAENYFGDFEVVAAAKGFNKTAIKDFGLEEAALIMKDTVAERGFVDPLEEKEIKVLSKRFLTGTAQFGLNVLDLTLNITRFLK